MTQPVQKSLTSSTRQENLHGKKIYKGRVCRCAVCVIHTDTNTPQAAASISALTSKALLMHVTLYNVK
jgi:hypothetical protein